MNRDLSVAIIRVSVINYIPSQGFTGDHDESEMVPLYIVTDPCSYCLTIDTNAIVCYRFRRNAALNFE